jgi:tetratricopeptide (TPR) repeat protein
MNALTQDQLAYIKSYERSKSPRAIAKDLRVEVSQVQQAIQGTKTPGNVARGPRRWTLLAIGLAIVVAGLLAYSNNLDAGWHFDDHHAITANDVIQHPTFVGFYKMTIYRQVLYWTFALSWYLHGSLVRGWHIENDAIHVLNGLLVFGFALLTLRSPGARGATRWPQLVAGLAALVFVLHPVQTQAVTYITQRTESLAATFYLGALILYAIARLRRLDGHATGDPLVTSAPLAIGVGAVLFGAGFVVWRPGALLVPFLILTGLSVTGAIAALVVFAKRGRADLTEGLLLTGALAATFFGLETKEIAGTIPAAVLLWEALFARPADVGALGKKSLGERLRAAASTAPWATMLVILPYLAVRAGLSVKFLAAENSEEHAPGFAISGHEYFFTQLNVVATYLRLFLAPYHQTLDYDYPKSTTLFALPTLLSFVFVAGLVAVAVKSWRRRPLLSWGILFALVVLLPTSSFFVLPDFIYEHRIYLPLAGAGLVAALALERVIRFAVKDRDELGRKVFVGVALPVLVILLVLTRARNEVWANEETLWRDCIQKAPNKPRPKTNLGLYYQNSEPYKLMLKDGGYIGGVIIDGDTGIKPGCWVVKPTLDEQHRQFAVPKAECAGPPAPWGGIEKAEKLYDEAIAIDKYYFKARNNYALCEVQEGGLQAEQSIELEKEAARVEPLPGSSPEQVARARALARQFAGRATKHFENAAEHLLMIIESRPRDSVAMSNLANLYFSDLDRLDDAISWMEKSVAIEDGAPIVLAVLGEMYYTRACECSLKNDTSGALAAARRGLSAYQTFLERSGTDPNAPHIRYRLRLTEEGIKAGGRFKEAAEIEKRGMPGRLQGRSGLNEVRSQRWKPVYADSQPRSLGPVPGGN